jgi:integrase/recombinase XerD
VDSAKLEKRGACHMFRHTMATLMLEGGADVRYIQEMLGHADLESTMVYTQVSIRNLKKIHTATHPGATLERTPPAATHEEEQQQRDLLWMLENEVEEDE